MADFVEYLVNFFSPDKWFRLLIIDVNEFFNGSNEFWDASKHPPLDPLPGQFGEPAFDQVQP